MNSEKALSHIPPELRAAPWLRGIVWLLQIQTQQIQAQTEQIATLQQTIQDLRDELAHLKNIPKRPKFRPGGGDPKSRR